jgi:hypothetical protein
VITRETISKGMRPTLVTSAGNELEFEQPAAESA